MKTPLRVLLVEDSDDDAALLVAELRRGGYDVTWERVETAEAMRTALGRRPWDVILSDYQMPRFSGMAALELLKGSGKGLPFIIVSGAIGEDQAVAAMKAGAHDYLVKGKLARLVPAVERELSDATEWLARQRAELALQRSERKYRELVEHANSIILRWTREGKITFLNEYGQKFFGYPGTEILGRLVVGTVVAASESADREMRALADGIGAHPAAFAQSVSESLRRNGERVWVSWTNTLVLDELGEANEILSVGTDITELKRTEEALRLQSAALEAAANAIVITDRQGSIEWANPAFSAMTGYAAAEAVGKNPRELVKSGQHGGEFYRALWETILAGEVWRGEIVNRRKDGGSYTEEMTITPVRDPHGVITHFIAIKQDITERKQAGERIGEQAALLDNASDAMYVTALEGSIRFWNQGAERLYGWSAAEALGHKTTELLSLPGGDTADLAATVLSKGDWAGERRQKTKKGQEVVVFVRLTLVRDAAGKPASIFAIDTDITEKKQLETRFRQAQRLEALGTLASGLAHDLNNVLTPVLLGATTLRQGAKTDTDRELLVAMEASAQRGANIVRQVLTFARGIEGQRLPLQLRHLLRELGTFVSGAFPKNITLVLDVDKNLWPVLGEATQLHQVLMNLCVNARDAMPEGGRLSLTARNTDLDETFALMTPGAKSGPHVRMSVSDTGAGIPPEHFDKLFEPFFTTKEHGQGTGLGLSTALGIVKSHGGFLQFASEVGKGTCFEIYLPAAMDAKVVAEAGARPTPPRGNGELILVVDDEVAIQRVATKVLGAFGYRVATASDGAEGLTVFMPMRATVAAVITDMLMPGMDGPAFVRVLRRIEPGIRIIGVSGMGEGTTEETIASLALSAMLTKPFTAENLLCALHAVLQEPPGRKPGGSGSPWRGVSAVPRVPSPGTNPP